MIKYIIIIIGIIGIFSASLYYNLLEFENKGKTKNTLVYISSFYNETKIPNKFNIGNKKIYWINQRSFLAKAIKDQRQIYYDSKKNFNKTIFKLELLSPGVMYDAFKEVLAQNNQLYDYKNIDKIKTNKYKEIVGIFNFLTSIHLNFFFNSNVDYSYLRIEYLDEGFITKDKFRKKYNFYVTREDKGILYYTNEIYSCNYLLNKCIVKHNKKSGNIVSENTKSEKVYFINFK